MLGEIGGDPNGFGVTGLAIFESGGGPGGGGSTYEVSDGGASIAAGPGCMAAGPPGSASCSGNVTSISIDVEDMADSVELLLLNPLSTDILGGPGDDRLSGQIGSDAIAGEDGADALFGLGGDDSLEGGIGDDRVRGDEPFEFTPPGLTGDAGDDVVSGGEGTDTLDGGNGDDTVAGGPGDDVYGAATARSSFCFPEQPPCPAPPTNGADTWARRRRPERRWRRGHPQR